MEDDIRKFNLILVVYGGTAEDIIKFMKKKESNNSADLYLYCLIKDNNMLGLYIDFLDNEIIEEFMCNDYMEIIKIFGEDTIDSDFFFEEFCTGELDHIWSSITESKEWKDIKKQITFSDINSNMEIPNVLQIEYGYTIEHPDPYPSEYPEDDMNFFCRIVNLK